MTETATPKILLRRGELGTALGSERLAEELVTTNFLKAILSNSRIAFFLVSDVEPAVIAFSSASKGRTSIEGETTDTDPKPAQE